MTQIIVTTEDALRAIVEDAATAAIERAMAGLKSGEKQWLTFAEYAAFVGRDTSTVRRWARDGKLEVRTFGAERLVRVNSNL